MPLVPVDLVLSSDSVRVLSLVADIERDNLAGSANVSTSRRARSVTWHDELDSISA